MKKHQNLLSEFVINDDFIIDNDFIANAFNNYFANVGQTLVKKINFSVDPLSYIEETRQSISDFDVDEIKAIASQLRSTSACYYETIV